MAGIDNDKAQVILVGGFLIAIGVLSAILMLNSISYSQTIASQNGNAGDFGPIEFSDSAEVAVSEAMTGNGTDPSNATVEFEAYIQSYSDGANEMLSDEAVSASASVPSLSLDTTEAWMVGQRRSANFQNATGEDRWIMLEDISSGDTLEAEFELNVSEMESTGEFTLNATEENNFAPDFDVGWNLTAEITSPPTELTLTLTDFTGGSPDVDSVTTDITGNETVTIDVLDETVNGEGSGFPDGTSINTEDAQGFRFEDGSNGIGTYDFRFDGVAVVKSNFGTGGTSTGEPRGPCAGDGPPCRTVDGTEKHIVGVVHSIASDAVELDYVGRSTSYSKTIGGMVLDADDVNLEEIRNVDNASYFDVEITNNPNPAEEGSGSIDVDYRVTNTGTQTDTQNVTLEIPKGEVRAWTGDLTLSDSGIDTGTLSWSPDPNTNGSYTAYLISNESRAVDTTQVSVDKDTPSGAPGIPDGPVGFALPSPVFETLAGVTQR
jgi:hypothetical protein